MTPMERDELLDNMRRMKNPDHYDFGFQSEKSFNDGGTKENFTNSAKQATNKSTQKTIISNKYQKFSNSNYNGSYVDKHQESVFKRYKNIMKKIYLFITLTFPVIGLYHYIVYLKY